MRLIRHKLAPGHNSNNGKVDSEVNDRHRDYANDDRPRNCPPRIFYLVSDVTNVVVAEIVINTHARCRAKAEKKAEGKAEASWGKIKCAGGAEMHRSGDYYRQRSQ